MERPRKERVVPRLCFDGSSLLRDSAVNNDIDLMSEILKKRFNLRVSWANMGEALLKACRCGSLESADMLLGEGVHVDYQDEDLWTPLHMAAAGSHEKVVKLLIQNNADATLLDVDGRFAIDYAIDPRIKDILSQYLADSGVYTEDLPSIRARLPKAMFAAVSSGIKRKKNLNNYNKNGVSPLHTAAANGYLEIAQMLIDSGVDINCHDEEGLTPLYVAVKYYQASVARLLVSRGADTSVIDAEKLKALEESSSHLERFHHNPQEEDGQQQNRLLLSKISDISLEDMRKEAEQLRKFGYAGSVHDQGARIRALSVTKSFTPNNLPEMIYDDPSNLEYPNSPSLSASNIEEQYDTSFNMRKLVGLDHESDSSSMEVESVNGISTNSLETIEDELYDDAQSIRPPPHTNGHSAIGTDEEQLYDDAQSIRPPPHTNCHSAINTDEEQLYDDAQSIRPPPRTNCHSAINTDEEQLYDDAQSIRPPPRTNGHSAISTDEEQQLLYDDAYSVGRGIERSNEVPPSSNNGYFETENLYDDAITLKNAINSTNCALSPARPIVPQPYEEVGIKLRRKSEYEETNSGDRPRRKMTRRRSKLPSLESSEPPSSAANNGHQCPLGPSASVDNCSSNKPPGSRQRRVSQPPSASPNNIPVAWQYRMDVLSKAKETKEQESSHLQDPGPQHVPAHSRPMVQERSTQQKKQPRPRNHFRVPPLPIPSSPSHSPITVSPSHEQNRHSHNRLIEPYAMVASHSRLKTRFSSDSQLLSRSVSPTYMTVPEHPPLRYSSSVSSTEAPPTPSSPKPRSPGDNKEDVSFSILQGGVRKMKISERVPAQGSVGFHSQQPTPNNRPTNDGPPTKPSLYKPLRVVNPFQ